MSKIIKIVASIEKLHGGERNQHVAHQSYTAWLLRKRLDGLGSNVLKKDEASADDAK